MLCRSNCACERKGTSFFFYTIMKRSPSRNLPKFYGIKRSCSSEQLYGLLRPTTRLTSSKVLKRHSSQRTEPLANASAYCGLYRDALPLLSDLDVLHLFDKGYIVKDNWLHNVTTALHNTNQVKSNDLPRLHNWAIGQQYSLRPATIGKDKMLAQHIRGDHIVW
jgi:hypothetical protein